MPDGPPQASLAAHADSFPGRMHFSGSHARELAYGAMRSVLPPALLFSDRVRGDGGC